MPTLTAETIRAASGIEPLNLALLIVGVVALAVIWLAAVIVRNHKRDE